MARVTNAHADTTFSCFVRTARYMQLYMPQSPRPPTFVDSRLASCGCATLQLSMYSNVVYDSRSITNVMIIRIKKKDTNTILFENSSKSLKLQLLPHHCRCHPHPLFPPPSRFLCILFFPFADIVYLREYAHRVINILDSTTFLTYHYAILSNFIDHTEIIT